MGLFKYVQFVDGDCEVDQHWISSAREYLKVHPEVAAVSGNLQEAFPEHSLYNRLCAIEWNAPLGESSSVGGIALFRLEDFLLVGGFDSSLIAGEEPELCLRLRQKGKRIMRISNKMAKHDADIRSFKKWWLRSCRSGYGSLDVVTRLKGSIPNQDIPFYNMVQSVYSWTIIWTVLTIFLSFLGYLKFRNIGAVSGIMLGCLIWLAQTVKIGLSVKKSSPDIITALLYGYFTLIGKWAQLFGQYRYMRKTFNSRNK